MNRELVDERLIAFHSVPDLSGNSFALWDYVRKHTEFHSAWITSNSESAAILNSLGIEAYHTESEKGKKLLSTAKYICTTHYFPLESKIDGQVFVYLSHGSLPVKTIGFYVSNLIPEGMTWTSKLAEQTDVFVCPSNLSVAVRSSAHQMYPRKCVITGMPRCDYLFHSNGLDLIQQLLPIHLRDKQHYILYAPTFRKGWEKLNGKNLKGENIFLFDDFDAEKLQSYLQRTDSVIVAKLHPLEENAMINENILLPNNCFLLRSDRLLQKGIILEHILNAFDVMITDYSSIAYDYLLLNRPIIYSICDIREYHESRGFLVSPIESWMPGEKAKTFLDLLDALDDTYHGIDRYTEQRRFLCEIIHTFHDSLSSSRVFAAMTSNLQKENPRREYFWHEFKPFLDKAGEANERLQVALKSLNTEKQRLHSELELKQKEIDNLIDDIQNEKWNHDIMLRKVEKEQEVLCGDYQKLQANLGKLLERQDRLIEDNTELCYSFNELTTNTSSMKWLLKRLMQICKQRLRFSR